MNNISIIYFPCWSVDSYFCYAQQSQQLHSNGRAFFITVMQSNTGFVNGCDLNQQSSKRVLN